MPAHLVERARLLVARRSTGWTPPPLRDAATVVMVCDADDGLQVYLQRRVRTMAFAAGMYVFPGGAVDPADRDRAREILRVRDALLAGLAAIDGISFPAPAPELQIVTYAGDDEVGVDNILRGMEERGWIHFSDSQPPLLMFVIDPGAGEILDEYLTDLADVVGRARDGAFTSNRAAKAY